jgi:hypothetical protein
MMSCMLRIVAGLGSLICDGLRWLWLTLRSTSAVEAENLFLRRQLALYLERGVKPRRIDSITRIALTILSGFFDWRDALVVVRPQTLIRWHRAGWKLFWRLKSRSGCEQPFALGSSITIADDPTWGWVRGFRIPRSSRLPDRPRAIAAEHPTSCAPIGSSEDSITSTHWRPRDPFSGSESNFCGSQVSFVTVLHRQHLRMLGPTARQVALSR